MARQRALRFAFETVTDAIPSSWMEQAQGTVEGTVFRCPAPETTLRFQVHHTHNRGDIMMIRQLCRSFVEYLSTYGDPGVGDIVLSAGGYCPEVRQPIGDLNLYWWYSFGPLDHDPERFINEYLREQMTVEPDIVLCGSRRIEREARQAGYEALYFPIGVDTELFRPLGLERRGLGYAGSVGHKSDETVETVIGPFADREDFEWVSDLVLPEQLNLWYNNQLVTFGLTRGGQREWGTVNSRVFETLATGTPFVLREHPTVEEVLGFDFPYQVSTSEEVAAFVEEMEANPEATLAEFRSYSERVAEDHSYVKRLEALFKYIE